jgi:hypothetical protein
VVGNRDWALRLMKSGFIFIMVAATVLNFECHNIKSVKLS